MGQCAQCGLDGLAPHKCQFHLVLLQRTEILTDRSLQIYCMALCTILYFIPIHFHDIHFRYNFPVGCNFGPFILRFVGKAQFHF